ncbi:hypothetical protein AK88_02915 [Plasmodium fragile]|uniref:Uncharacterized protein n=1 Tax=Plasmodium fragile TaxID=5857 RepID=A0A0D9QKI8_PLAFR|nr:uncharacterized protein AK88_02915 [Plasmodium fragile]KJP87483.1 hypothetical protein AK88_02915 [Plasmodium fragile]
MDLHDKRNGEKHQLSGGALEEHGNEMVGDKANKDKRIYMKYHEGKDYKEEEKEDRGKGVPHKRNRRPSRTPPSIGDHAVDKGEEYHLVKKKKKAKIVNELSSRALSPNGEANNPMSYGDDQDSYDRDDHQVEGNKWQKNKGYYHHVSDNKTYNMRKMAHYPSHTDTSPGEKRNLRSSSIPSSISLKKGNAAQEDESTTDEHIPRNKDSKLYELKSKEGGSSFICHPDGSRRRVSPTRRKSFSQSSVEMSDRSFTAKGKRSFQGGKYAKEGRGSHQQEASHGSDVNDKSDTRDTRDKHGGRRRSYDDASPYEQKYPTQEATRGDGYVVEGRGRPHGAHLSGESVRREDETSSEYRQESTFSKSERNKMHKRGKQPSRSSGSASRGRSRSAGRHSYNRRKRPYSPLAKEDPPNTYKKKFQSGRKKQDWHKDGGNYYHGEGEYEKELPPKWNQREGSSRGGSAKLSDDREDPNVPRKKKKEYPQNGQCRGEKSFDPHGGEGNESPTDGKAHKGHYINHSPEKGQRSEKYNLHSREYSSRKRDRSEMDDDDTIYDKGRYYYPHGKAYHARGRNHIKRLNKYRGDTDEEEKEVEFKPRSDQRINHHQFETDYHGGGDKHNETNPHRDRSCDNSGDVGSDISVNELNMGRMKEKKILEFVQIDGCVEIELLSDADFTNWLSDDCGVSEEEGVEPDAADLTEGGHVKGDPVHIKFRNSHLRKFVLCSGQFRMGKLPPPNEWSHPSTQKRSMSICSSDGNTYSNNKYAPTTRTANYKQSEYRQEKNSSNSFVGNKFCDVSLLKRRGSHSDRSESPDSFRRNGYMSGKNYRTKYDPRIEERKQIPSVDREANRRRSSSASAVRDELVECRSGDREGEFPERSRWREERRKYTGGHQVDDKERIRDGSRSSSCRSGHGNGHGSRRFGESRDATHIQEMITPPKFSGDRVFNQIERKKDKTRSHREDYERRSPKHHVHGQRWKSPHAQSGMRIGREEDHRTNGKYHGDDTRVTKKEEGSRAGAQVTVTKTPTWVNVPEFGSIPNYINEIIKNMNSSYEINEPIDMLNLKAGKSFRTPELLQVVNQMTSTKSFLNFLDRRKEAQKKWKMVARNLVHEEFKILSDSISRDVIDAKIKFLTSSLRSL